MTNVVPGALFAVVMAVGLSTGPVGAQAQVRDASVSLTAASAHPSVRSDSAAVGASQTFASGQVRSASCQGVCGAESRLPSTVIDVRALAADDAWVVGDNEGVAAASHWDGTSWHSQPPRSPGTRANGLEAVDPRATDDVWAVGFRSDSDTEEDPLIERWDGSRWRVVPCPSAPDREVTQLEQVSADTADDAWAVGRAFRFPGPPKTIAFAVHWDGTEWKQVPVGDGIVGLWDVEAVSPTDAWAVGAYGKKGPSTAAVVLHWDGSSWAVVKQLGGWNALESVYVAGPQDVWVVGWAGRKTLALHWDGTKWTEMPAQTHRRAGLYDAAPYGTGGVLAVGFFLEKYTRHPVPLVMRWNGSRWTRDPVDALPDGTWLRRVTSVSPDLAWATGTVGELPGERILIMWDGTGWHKVTG